MSGSNWRQIAAVGLAALLLGALLASQYGYGLYSSYKSEHTDQRNSIATYQAGTSEQYAEVCVKEGFSISFIKCVFTGIDANREAQRSQYDLQAQQEMAEWAYAVVLISIGTFFTSLFGVFLVWTTFRETKRGNEIAHEELRSVNRPKVFVSFFHAWNEGGHYLNPNNRRLSLRPGEKVYVAAQATNIGPGATIVTQSDFEICWAKDGLPMSNPLWGRKCRNPLQLIDWSNHAAPSNTVGSFKLPAENAGKWCASSVVPRGQTNLYVVGYLFHKDPYGHISAVWFARRYNPKSDSFVTVQNENYERN